MLTPEDSGQIDRRAFLASMAAAGLGGYALAGCTPGTSAVEGPRRLERIGVQLYTVRDRMQQGVRQTLEAVAEIGYQEVETAGLYDMSPERFRDELDRVDLVSPAGHYSVNALRDGLDATLATAETLGQRWVVVPSLPQSDRTVDGYRRVAEEFNRFANATQQRGLRFAYHNHDWEFAPLDGASAGYDLLLAETDPQLVFMELDVFWAVRGGRDPLDLIERHPGRFRLYHVKDMADIAGTPRMTEVGQGEIDFASIFAAGERTGAQHYFVEHDNPDDSLASIRSSYEYVRGLSF